MYENSVGKKWHSKDFFVMWLKRAADTFQNPDTLAKMYFDE